MPMKKLLCQVSNSRLQAWKSLFPTAALLRRTIAYNKQMMANSSAFMDSVLTQFVVIIYKPMHQNVLVE